MDRIIFHIPWKLSDVQSASQLRPVQMLKAFSQLGYQVDVVMGSRRERKRQFLEIKKNLAKGNRYSFCYSESSTLPTIFASGMTDFFSGPLIDIRLFFLMSRKHIPLGLFLRDIYWRFPSFFNSGDEKKDYKSRLKNLIFFWAYWFDTLLYKLFVTKLYLPSDRMAVYLPKLFGHKPVEDLPSGIKDEFGTGFQNRKANFTDRQLRLLYVGGIGNHYRLHKLFETVVVSPGVELTVCTREEEWKKNEKEYRKYGNTVHIVHNSHKDIRQLYMEHDITLLFTEPSVYRNFAMPFKLFEYMGYGLPVIGTEGTAAGDFIEKYRIGWVVPYSKKALHKLLHHLSLDKEEIIRKSNNARDLISKHTWLRRAEQVKDDLKRE